MANVKWDVNVNVKSESAKTAATDVDKLEKTLKSTDKAAEAAEKKIEALQSTLKKLKAPGEIKKLEKEIKEFGHESSGVLGKLGRFFGMHAIGLHGVGIAAGEAKSKVGEFLEFTGAIAAVEILHEIAEKLVEIGEEAVKSAAKAERMNRVFSIQQGGKAQGKAAQSWVERFSKTSEFSEAENESAFVGLRRQGVGSQKAGLIMKASADIAAGSEDKGAAYQEAISAFERIQQTGRVNARMLRPLGIGVEDFKKMPEFKGMTNAKVNEAIGKKDVNENELFQLIMAHAGETKIGTRSADNVDLLETKMNKLQELPERFFKKLGDTKAVGELATALDGILKKFDPDSPAGSKIFDGLEHLMTRFSETIGSIDLDDVADSITDDVIPAIEGLVDLVKPMVELMERMFRGAHRLHDMIAGPSALHNDTTPLARQEEEFRAQVFEHQINKAGTSTVIGAQTGSKVSVHHSKMHFEQSAADAFSAGESVSEGMAEGAEAKAGAATDAIGDVADAMVDTVKKKHKTHSPSEVFSDIGEMDIAGYVGGVRGGRGDVQGAMASTFEVPSGGARTAVGGAAGGVNVTLQTTINLGGEGGSPEQQGKKLADAYNARMRQHILSAIEQALTSGGD